MAKFVLVNVSWTTTSDALIFNQGFKSNGGIDTSLLILCSVCDSHECDALLTSKPPLKASFSKCCLDKAFSFSQFYSIMQMLHNKVHLPALYTTMVVDYNHSKMVISNSFCIPYAINSIIIWSGKISIPKYLNFRKHQS